MLNKEEFYEIGVFQVCAIIYEPEEKYETFLEYGDVHSTEHELYAKVVIFRKSRKCKEWFVSAEKVRTKKVSPGLFAATKEVPKTRLERLLYAIGEAIDYAKKLHEDRETRINEINEAKDKAQQLE